LKILPSPNIWTWQHFHPKIWTWDIFHRKQKVCQVPAVKFYTSPWKIIFSQVPKIWT
jgi:hypothetical protein